MNKLSALKRFSDAKPIIVQSYFQAFSGEPHQWIVISDYLLHRLRCIFDEKLMRARKLSYLEKRRKTYHLYPTITFSILQLILSNQV